MDQLKDFFNQAVKYGFWIGSVVVFLFSTGIWYLSTARLADESQKQTSSIKSSIMTVSNIRSELSTHPNETSHAEMEKLIKDRQNQVLQSWESLFERQREILVWPEEELTTRFVDQFRNKIPIEIHVPYPTPESDELTTSMRSTYAKHIKEELPDLADIAGTDWVAEFTTATRATGLGRTRRETMTPMEMALKERPLVIWSQQSQENLLSDLFPWRQSGLPTTLDIYYSQENLWVLRQLLEIIGEVNGAAKQPYQAKIHEINTISIGRSVKFGAGQILPPGSDSKSGLAGAMSSAGLDDVGMDSVDFGFDGSSDGSVEPDPADLRYVSESLESISASDLRGALKDIKPQNVSLAIAKRLPVMMSLKMNQRAVPELLAACGSANLMVKVRQTRIMPKGKSSSSSAGSGGFDDAAMVGSGGGSGNRNGKNEVTDEFPLDMQVEIYGIIYIYNPPDLEKLAIEQINEETVDQAVQDLSGETKEKPDTQPAADTDPDGGDGVAADPDAADPSAANQAPADGDTTDQDDRLPAPGGSPASPPDGNAPAQPDGNGSPAGDADDPASTAEGPITAVPGRFANPPS